MEDGNEVRADMREKRPVKMPGLLHEPSQHDAEHTRIEELHQVHVEDPEQQGRQHHREDAAAPLFVFRALYAARLRLSVRDPRTVRPLCVPLAGAEQVA